MIKIKLLLYSLGIALTVSGLVFIICYLNILTIGYNFLNYVKFIIGRIECWNFIFGLLILAYCLYKEV